MHSLAANIIGDEVTQIGKSAFSGCIGLTSVTIPPTVERIESCAFLGCSRLTNIYIPNSVKYIRKYSFMNCPIDEVILPKSTKTSVDSFDKMTKVKRAKVFISYSWDCEKHMKWVRKLAKDLNNHGIFVIYDKGLRAGDDLNVFMKQISESETENIICIMTPEYKRKAEDGIGGVGEEYPIIKKEIEGGKDGKYIPILRKGTKEESLTKEFKKLAFLDFTNDDNYAEKFEELVNTIFHRLP